MYVRSSARRRLERLAGLERIEGRTVEPDEGIDWMIERLGHSPEDA